MELPENDQRMSNGMKIGLALIPVIGMVIVGYWQFVVKPNRDKQVQYAGRVRNDITNQPVHGAKVSVEEDETVPQIKYTDSEGVFHFYLREANNEVRLRIEADKYEAFDRNVSLSRTGIEDVRLRPIQQYQPDELPSQPIKFKITVKRGTTAKLYNNELFITVNHITSNGKPSAYGVFGAVSSPGYAPLPLQNGRAGDRFTYHGKDSFDIQILTVAKASAEFVTLQNK